MAIITALVFAEKVLPHGRKTSVAAAAALCTYGRVALAVPATLPTVF